MIWLVNIFYLTLNPLFANRCLKYTVLRVESSCSSPTFKWL